MNATQARCAMHQFQEYMKYRMACGSKPTEALSSAYIRLCNMNPDLPPTFSFSEQVQGALLSNAIYYYVRGATWMTS